MKQTTKKNFLKEIIQIIIRVKKINPDFDNFIAIDDISFKAVLCSETTDEWDLDSNFFMAPMLSVLQQRPILSSKACFPFKSNLTKFFILFS